MLPRRISPLEHRILESVVFQWDGTHDQAVAVMEDLKGELRMRGGELIAARYTHLASKCPVLSLGLRRRSDEQEWSVEMIAGEWLVIWLRREQIMLVEQLYEVDGGRLFQPAEAVITIHPERTPEPRSGSWTNEAVEDYQARFRKWRGMTLVPETTEFDR